MKWIFTLLLSVMLFTGCSSIYIKNHGLTANPMEVQKGDKTTLSWNIEGNVDFDIYISNMTDNQILFDKLPKTGSREITLNTTTTFMLNAKYKGKVRELEGTSMVTVKVK
jgi:hypothetical protein